jgi:hypothetical protein
MSDDELTKVFPQQPSVHNTYYAPDSQTCSNGAGVQRPTTIDMTLLPANSGSSTTIDTNTLTFTQCQDLDVLFTFAYEDGGSTNSAENQFAYYNPTNGHFTANLVDYQTAPGVRLFQLAAHTVNDDRPVTLALPMIIYPTGYNALTDDASTAAKIYSCVADNSYPKIIGDLQNDFIQYGADIDSTNGNTIVCGYAGANAFPNSFWADSSQVAMNMMANLDGKIFWAYTVSFISS